MKESLIIKPSMKRGRRKKNGGWLGSFALLVAGTVALLLILPASGKHGGNTRSAEKRSANTTSFLII